MNADEEVVLTAMKKNGQNLMRMERLKKKEIDPSSVHYIAGGPYKGILVNKQATGGFLGILNNTSVEPPEGRVEFMAYLINSDSKNGATKDQWTLRFWFRGKADGVTKKKTFTSYFAELVSPGNVPRKYVGFIKRALVLLQNYDLVKRLELEVEEKGDEDEDLPTIKSFVSVFTPDSYTYRFVPEVNVASKNFLTFKIKTKSDASLVLCAVYGDVQRKAYEILLGTENNTKSFIRDGSLGPVKSEASTYNVLNEDDFRFFWISWADHHVEVGQGAKYGQTRFLSWKVPPNRCFKINSMAVATSRAGKGEWEFAEILDEKDLKKEAKRNKIKNSLLWLAKKQKILNILEDAYPNSININQLFKLCKVDQGDTISAVVMLKNMESKGVIKEIEKGIWIRMQNKEETTDHNVILVKEMPSLVRGENPQIAIITSMYNEKLAVDAMIEDKKTYVKYKTEGESQIYTLGRIGDFRVVSTKLSRMGDAEGDMIAAENTVTRLLGIFQTINHVLLVGVGGAVPNYEDYKEHVRLGDVVVSSAIDDTEATYVYCSKVEKVPSAKGFSYSTRIFAPSDRTLEDAVNRMTRKVDSNPSAPKPWESHLEVGLETLRGQDSNFHRPNIKRDMLFYTKQDASVIRVDHPRPTGTDVRVFKEGQTRVCYGAIGCGQKVARTDPMRSDFAHLNHIKAFHQEQDVVLESVEGNRCESFLIILGMCDYADGTKKEWSNYASLAAAAYMKALVLSLQSHNNNRNSSHETSI